MSGHVPVWERDNGHTRWSCPDCGWSTPWTAYHDPHAGAAAVRHAAAMSRGGAMQQPA